MEGDQERHRVHDGLSMKNFSPLSGSEGPRREFKITWGLRAGYRTSGRIYDLEEAIRAAHRWMRERHARGDPFVRACSPAAKLCTRAQKEMLLMTVNRLRSSPAKCCRSM